MLRLLALIVLALFSLPAVAAEPVALTENQMTDWSGTDGAEQVFAFADFTLTLTLSGDDGELAATLRVEKPGEPPMELSGLGAGAGYGQVGVVRWDDNGLRSVLFAVHSGGAHCCLQIVAATETEGGLVTQDVGYVDSDSVSPHDIDGDGVFELPLWDRRFGYTFDAFAFAVPPARLIKSAWGETYDGSAHLPFRPFFAEEIEGARASCSGETWDLGACAGLLAMAARLGTYEAELAKVKTALDAGKRTSGWDEFEICGNDDCSTKQSFADFIPAIGYALRQWGYLGVD